MLLKEGQAQSDVEVLRIDSASGTVSVAIAGKPVLLTLEGESGFKSANKIENQTPPIVDLVSADLEAVMSLYADFKSRTVLQHPELGDGPFSVSCNPQTTNEVVDAFEKMFNEQKIATISDGNHFVMVVPFAFTNEVNPRSGSLPQTNAIISQFSVNFLRAPVQLVLQTYSDFAGKKLDNITGVPGRPGLTLRQTTPLSRDEIIYAIETQIAWRNIHLVPETNGVFKCEWVPPTR